jgi:hypothetical protein
MKDGQATRRTPRALSTWVPEGRRPPRTLQSRLTTALRRLASILPSHEVTMVQLDQEGAIVFANRGPATLHPGARLATLTQSPVAFESHRRDALHGTTEFELVFLTGETLSCRASPLRLEGTVVGTLLLGRASSR